MTVRESQRAGVWILAMICLAVYGLSLCTAGKPRKGGNIPFAVQSPETIAVEFRGGREEGIYFFPRGTRLQEWLGNIPADVLTLSKDSALDFTRSEGLFVSRNGELRRETLSAAKRLALDLPLDVNQADADDLALVPGIGERMAAAIVLLRRKRGGFSRLEELCAVPGIKEKKLSQIRLYLSVGDR